MNLKKKVLKREELPWNKVNADIPVIFWGCGNNAGIVKGILSDKGIVPIAYCDNNPNLIGTKKDGIEILSYAQVKEKFTKYYIILTVAINNAVPIRNQLIAEGEKNPIFHVEKPFKVDDELLEYEELENRIDVFEKIYGLLEDELSKKILVENINFKLSGNKLGLLEYVDGDTFFDDKLIPMSSDYSYVDVGAYTGDTLLKFYAFCGGRYKKMYAVEPDLGNFDSLQKLVKFGRLDNVYAFNVGGWDCKDTLTFYTTADKNTKNFDSPNFFKDMQHTMPNKWEIKENEFVEEKIPVNTIDNLLEGEECNIIKINALAADFQTLKGCKTTIERYKPIIVGEFGTRKENLTGMIMFMKEINPSYKIYLRQKMIFGDCKTVFFAIDGESK